jgi:hypothetical protein
MFSQNAGLFAQRFPKSHLARNHPPEYIREWVPGKSSVCFGFSEAANSHEMGFLQKKPSTSPHAKCSFFMDGLIS